MDEAHEAGDGFLAAESDAPEAFELVEEALDLMALLWSRQSIGGLPVRLGLAYVAELVK